MIAKKLPKYSWLNFQEKQQIKQFTRENPKHPAEFAKSFLKNIYNFDALNTGLSG
jgi:hypothetical protein